MTREEMIARQMKATGFTLQACTGFIDQLAGAGLIKLDDPPTVSVRLAKAMYEWRDRGGPIMEYVDGAGLRITEK